LAYDQKWYLISHQWEIYFPKQGIVLPFLENSYLGEINLRVEWNPNSNCMTIGATPFHPVAHIAFSI
jgi:hypothetical protein